MNRGLNVNQHIIAPDPTPGRVSVSTQQELNLAIRASKTEYGKDMIEHISLCGDGEFIVRGYEHYLTVHDSVTAKIYGAPIESLDLMLEGRPTVESFGRSHIIARNTTRVTACEDSIVEAYDDSYICAVENSLVCAFDNSKVDVSVRSTSTVCIFSSGVGVRVYDDRVPDTSDMVILSFVDDVDIEVGTIDSSYGKIGYKIIRSPSLRDIRRLREHDCRYELVERILKRRSCRAALPLHSIGC